MRRARRAFDVAQTRLRAQRFVSHFRCRKHPSIRSMSVSACRPVDSMEASVSRTVSGLDSEDAALRPMDHDQVESVSHDIVKLSGDARTLVGNGSRALTSRSRLGKSRTFLYDIRVRSSAARVDAEPQPAAYVAYVVTACVRWGRHGVVKKMNDDAGAGDQSGQERLADVGQRAALYRMTSAANVPAGTHYINADM